MRWTLLAAAALAAVPAAPAAAVTPAYTVTLNSLYVPGDIKIVKGGSVTLVSGEAIAHDLVSTDDENGIPLFKSRIVAGVGDNAPVVGVSALGLGWHQFYCSLHEEMRGTIEVVAE